MATVRATLTLEGEPALLLELLRQAKARGVQSKVVLDLTVHYPSNRFPEVYRLPPLTSRFQRDIHDALQRLWNQRALSGTDFDIAEAAVKDFMALLD